MEDLQVTVAVKTGDSVAFGTVIWLREKRLCFEAHARTKEMDLVELRMELRGRSDTVYAHGQIATKQKRQGAVPVFIVAITRMSAEDEKRLKLWLEDIARGGTSANVDDLLTAQDVVASTSYSTSAHETANALKRYDEKRSRFRKKDDAEDDPMGLKASKSASSASFAGDAGRQAIRNALRKGVTTSRTQTRKQAVKRSADPASSAWLKKLHERMDHGDGEAWSHWEQREREASERRTRPAPTRVPAPLPPLPSVEPVSSEPVSQDSEAASADEYARWAAEMESASRSQAAADRADLTPAVDSGPLLPTADEMIGEPDEEVPAFVVPPELAPIDDDPSEPSAAEPEPESEPEPEPFDDDDVDPACFLDVGAGSAMVTWGTEDATRRDWTQQLQHGAFLLTLPPPHPSLLSRLELVMALPNGQFHTAMATVVNAFAGGVGLQVEVSDEMRRVFAAFG